MTLSQQQIDFIIDLSNEMKTQDTRCTAQPYGLILTEEVIEVRGEDYASHCAAYWNEYSYYDFKEFVDAVADYYEDDENHPEWVNAINECNCFSDLEHKLPMHQENNEPDIYWYERTQVPRKMNSNFFLTEKGYEAYLEKDRHNLTKPESFGIHLRRNDEMAQVIEIIHAIADQLKQETPNG